VLSVSIRDVEPIDPGVWKVRLEPADVQFLGSTDSRVGPVSVVLLSQTAVFDKENFVLTFNPSGARLLNLGTTESALIIESAVQEHIGQDTKSALPPAPRAPGDSFFLSTLSPELRDFGTALLQAVRSQFPGELKYYERSGKFVESPDNFWTVRIQSRDVSFRITVRGRPESFEKPSSLDLKPDMTGYTSLKLSSAGQIEDLIKVLRQVRKKRR
jgi:hypothetical protein